MMVGGYMSPYHRLLHVTYPPSGGATDCHHGTDDRSPYHHLLHTLGPIPPLTNSAQPLSRPPLPWGSPPTAAAAVSWPARIAARSRTLIRHMVRRRSPLQCTDCPVWLPDPRGQRLWIAICRGDRQLGLMAGSCPPWVDSLLPLRLLHFRCYL